jgi:3-phenylpropionate/trans-cinnamate dioxygenase ferredoxin reductase subunit
MPKIVTTRAVVIVGAGLAGARTAETLRAEGYDGRLTLVGDEPVAPYQRPALSKEFMLGTRDESSLLLRKASFWEENAIELMLGSAVVELDPIERVARTRSGTELHFDHAVLATGARPRRLPLDLPTGVHELRTLADARALRDDLVPGSHLVVIGGGFVGAEVASTARTLGVRVTIVEAANAPVARVLGEQVGLLLAARWQEHGVDVRLRTGVAHIRADASGRVSSLLLTDGAELRADSVVGVGVEAARELMPKRPAIHVHAAGDVVGPGHWTAAAFDGAAAARRILGLPSPAPQPSYVWSDQFGLRLQVVGTPEPDDTLAFDGDGDSFAVRYLDETGSTRAALLANRPAEAAEMRRRLAESALAVAA